MQSSFTNQELDRRAATIIRAVRVGQVSPGSDTIAELVEVTEAIADRPVKPIVVARMTITRAVVSTMIVEVQADATFNTFYRIYSQDGRRRSTKRLMRTANRNEGLQPYYQAYRMTPGLEKLAEFWQTMPQVDSVKVRIIRRRAYKRLIHAAPDVLGLTKTAPFKLSPPFSVRHS